MTQTPLVFIWHFHQPDYRDPWSGRPSLPWVRLHACRGYSDLLTGLQRGEAKWTVNFSGSLLDQLQQWNAHEHADVQFLLAQKAARELTLDERVRLLDSSFWANPRTLIQPLARYRELYAKRGNWNLQSDRERVAKSFTHQELRDLQVLFNLSWCGFTLRSTPVAASLLSKGAMFSEDEKRQLLSLHADTVTGLLKRYQTAMQDGNIELMISPDTHPILPLLIDTNCASEAMPESPLPEPPYRHPKYASLQLERAAQRFETAWQRKISGVWSSEGSLSDETLELAAKAGFRWTMGDEGLLSRTLQSEITPELRNRVYRYESSAGPIHVLFRNRAISDAIGFRYQSWQTARALEDLEQQLSLEAIDSSLAGCVTIALDGENAWESFDDGAEGFLTGLARAFVRSPAWRTATPRELIDRIEPVKLSHIASGSWINADFRVWCGDEIKNKAWQQLESATQACESIADEATRLQAEKHLLAAQASDWFWWYGDLFHSENDFEFDRLYRGHLLRIYELAGQPTPEELEEPVKSSVVRNATLPVASLDVTVDGRETGFHEWLGAGEVDTFSRGAIRRSDYPVQRVRYGYNNEALFFALDGAFIKNFQRYSIAIFARCEDSVEREVVIQGRSGSTSDVNWQVDEILEISLSNSAIGCSIGGVLHFRIELREHDQTVQRIPEFGTTVFQKLAAIEHDVQYWP